MNASEFSAIEEQININISKLEQLNMASSGVNPPLYRETTCCINNLKASVAFIFANLEGQANGTDAK